jgi:copper homeostasis protein
MDMIHKLQRNYGKEIQIMAGSGVNPSNAKEIAATGIANLHFTSRKPGPEGASGMGQRFITDEKKMQAILELFT